MRISLSQWSGSYGKAARRRVLPAAGRCAGVLMCVLALSFLSLVGATAEEAFDLPATLDNTNWMSAIPDARLIHEINIPGVHDACTAKVWNAHLYGGLSEKYAVTQQHDINGLLNSGVRLLDLRFTNCQSHITNAALDDLFLCHGSYQKLNVDGLYYCCKANGDVLTFEDVIEDVHDFLLAHPTETILINVKIEYEDTKNKKLPDPYETLRGKLENCGAWMWFDGSRMPSLGEVRGKAVLLNQQKDSIRLGLGINAANESNSSTLAGESGITFYYENAWDLKPEAKVDAIKSFYHEGMHSALIPQSAEEHLGFGYMVYTSSNKYLGSTPKEVAQKVNPYAFTDQGALFDDRSGRLFGWVFSDFVTSSDDPIDSYSAFADNLWRSNYPEDPNYYATLTYRDDGQDIETVHVLKGTDLKLRDLPTGANCWIELGDELKICPASMVITEDLVLDAQHGMLWSDFRNQVKSHQGKSLYIRLEGDVIRPGGDVGPIEIPAGTQVYLDLNGYTIDGGAEANPGEDTGLFALSNEDARLSIIGPGTLQNGCGKGGAGAISILNSSAQVALENLSIEGNASEQEAGGILLHAGSLTLENVIISGNSSADTASPGGLEVHAFGQLTVSGNTVIRDNSSQGRPENLSNLALASGNVIRFDGPLDEGAEIYLHSDANIVRAPITEGYDAHNSSSPDTFFKPDDVDSYRVVPFFIDDAQMEAGLSTLQHAHAFTYAADGADIIAACSNEGCYLPEIQGYSHAARLTLRAPALTLYGENQDEEASLYGLIEDMDAPTFTYWAKDGEDFKPLDAAPRRAGDYRVLASLGAATAELDYSIARRPVKVSGLRAMDKVYDGTTDAQLDDSQVRFDGLIQGDALTVTAVGEFKTADVQYASEISEETGETTKSESVMLVPVSISDIVLGGADADQYVLDVSGSQTGSAACISPAPSSCVPPQEVRGLYYDGTMQIIAQPGTGVGGTLVYAVIRGRTDEPEGDTAYTTDIPEQAEPGVYFVWYKVLSDDNHSDSNWQYIITIIGRGFADFTPPAAREELVYNGEEQALVTPGTETHGLTVAYALGDSRMHAPGRSDFKEDIPTAVNAGVYYVWSIALGDDLYGDGGPCCEQVFIAKRPMSLTVADVDVSYDGEPHAPALQVLDPAEGYYVEYSTDGETFTAQCPSVTEPNEGDPLTVTCRISADNYYSLTVTSRITVYPEGTVPTPQEDKAKAAILENPTAADGIVYDGEAHPLLTSPGRAEGGTLQYALGEEDGHPGPYADAIPTATDAGSYRVWYRVKGDDSHTDTADQYLPVKIHKAASADADIFPTPEYLTYTGSPQPLLTALPSDQGAWMYKLGTQNEDGTVEWPEAYAAEVPCATDAGTYFVKARFVGDTNHKNGEKSLLTCVVERAAPLLTAPEPEALSYTGSPQPLLKDGKAGSAQGGILLYCATGSLSTLPDSGSEAVPTVTDAGTYVVWYRVQGDANHTDTNWQALSVVMTASVRVNQDSHGTVTASCRGTEAAGRGIVPGSRVELSAVPESGYALYNMSVVCGGNTVICTRGADGIWSFQMPEGDVTVTPDFEKVDVLLDGLTSDVPVAYLNSDGLLEDVSAGLTVHLSGRTLAKGYYRVTLSRPGEGVATATVQGISPYNFQVERTFVVAKRFSGTTLKLPKGLRDIGTSAFEGMGTTVVELPSGALAIGSRAFAGSGGLLMRVPDAMGTLTAADDAFAGRSLPVFMQASPGNEAVRALVQSAPEAFVYLINR